MAVITESRQAGEFILAEANGTISREQVTIGAGNLDAGTVLGRITASGNYVILAPAASDGSQTAAGVLFQDVNATAAAQRGVAIVRHAEVRTGALAWPVGITAPQRTAAISQLAALGILVR
jgi:hypothetical protein